MSTDSNNHNRNHNHNHNHNSNSNSSNSNSNNNRRRRRESGAADTNPRKRAKKSKAHQGRDLQERKHPLVQKRLKDYPDETFQDRGNGKLYCQACNKSLGAEVSTVKRHLGKL